MLAFLCSVIAALGAILETAKEVPTGITNYKRFIKTGTRKDARRDFLALSPEFPDGKVYYAFQYF